VQGYVSNQGDGWHYTTGYLERHLEQRRRASEAEAPDVHGGYLALIDTLGRRTAELHQALAMPGSDASFAAEPLLAADIAADRARIERDLPETLALLATRRSQLPVDAQPAAEALLEGTARLQALIERCARAPASGAARGQRIRIHGDFHLAQVLVTKNDFVFIDFEGEPSRPLAERRAKRSPLRDVAGLLRSFDYAAHAALRAATADSVDGVAALAASAQAWRRQARAAFLAGYDAVGGQAGQYDTLAADGLLGLYELEKALYELRYELNNRPDWAGIPLMGLVDLLA